MSIFLSNVQRFSLHDGPGIRTTVYLKGCSINCPWCCNPENINGGVQEYQKNNVEGIYGKEYTTEELYTEIIKDRVFYGGDIDSKDYFNITSIEDFNKLPGGVTFSGGEALIQIDALVPVCKKLHDKSIHITIETSLFVYEQAVEAAIDHIDFFYVDIKILDKQKCRDVLRGDIDLYYKNLYKVFDSGKPVILRIPVIGEYTDDKVNRVEVVDFIYSLKNQKHNILKIELLKEHNLGISKYESLIAAGNDVKVPIYKGVKDDLLKQYEREIEVVTDIPVEILKI